MNTLLGNAVKKERLVQFKKRLPTIAAVITVIVLLLGSVFFGSNFLEVTWIIDGTLLAVLILILALTAGFVVLKSLFLVAAELSLLIFLAQSYCSAPQRSAASNSALKSLLAVGFLYIVFSFAHSLYKALKENYQMVKREKLSIEKISSVFFYPMFIGLFVWEIYLVMQPIILALCINK